MLLLPAAIGTFLLVNLLCACLALGVGFAAGVWFFGAKMAKPAAAKEPPKKPVAKPSDDVKRAAERAAMAASRVADLANTVASDVGDHAAKMKAISADLAGIDRDSDNCECRRVHGDGPNARSKFRVAATARIGGKATRRPSG